MSATYSVKELIHIAFDKFYDDVSFDNFELPDNIKTRLEYLEENVAAIALSTRTTEAVAISEDAYEDGYDCGYVEGRDDGHGEGYDEGFEDGYDTGYGEGHKDGYNDAIEDSK